MSVLQYPPQTWQQNEDETEDLVENYIRIENNFVSILSNLYYGSDVAHIYNPLQYASELHKKFLKKFLHSRKKVLFLGISPGPWGMCQTGIPFGEVNIVRSYLKIRGKVFPPNDYHPKKPVDGLKCHKSEIGDKRLWDLFIELSKNKPTKFFKNCFIHNYFPLSLMDENAKNISLCDLKSQYQKCLQDICDKSLNDIINLLHIDTIVAIGKYAEKRSNEVIQNFNLNNVKVVTIPHPSTHRAGTTKKWKHETLNQLKSYDILKLIK